MPVLVALAAGFLAWRGVRLGGALYSWLPWVLAGAALVAIQVRAWVRASGRPVRRLVACDDGSLWLQTAGHPPCRMFIGLGTRLVGPSVFLDLGAASNPSVKRLRAWLTPFDMPMPAIRRWSVLLPRCGRKACS